MSDRDRAVADVLRAACALDDFHQRAPGGTHDGAALREALHDAVVRLRGTVIDDAIALSARAFAATYPANPVKGGDRGGDSASEHHAAPKDAAEHARDHEAFRERVTGIEPATFSLGSGPSRTGSAEKPTNTACDGARGARKGEL